MSTDFNPCKFTRLHTELDQDISDKVDVAINRGDSLSKVANIISESAEDSISPRTVRRHVGANCSCYRTMNTDSPGDNITVPKYERHREPKAPKGWEPQLEIEGDEGHLISRPVEDGNDVSWAKELDRRLGEGASSRFKVVGDVTFKSWDGWDGDGNPTIKTSFKWKLRKRDKGRERRRRQSFEDIEELIKGHEPHERQSMVLGDQAFCVFLADWQVGKADGDGVEGTVDAILDLKHRVLNRVRELRKIGRNIGTLYVFGMGDLFEKCDNFYAEQTFTVELNRRQQERRIRRLLVELLVAWSEVFDEVVVTAVGGNHGENRRDGRRYTGSGDNDDVAVFEQVADAFAMNPEAFGHVHFYIPEDRLTVTLEIMGTIVGVTHGHLCDKSRKGKHGKVWTWWTNHAMGQKPIGDADILVTAHKHHYRSIRQGRIWIQCPAMDGGSRWWEDVNGLSSERGTVTAVIDADGWKDEQIL